MKNQFKKIMLLGASSLIIISSFAQSKTNTTSQQTNVGLNKTPVKSFNTPIGSSNATLWKDVSESKIVLKGKRQIIPESYRTVALNLNELKLMVANAQLKNSSNQSNDIIISLPNPDGGFADYKVYKNTTMHPDLQANFPEIRTYDAISTTNPSVFAKIDVTIKGFHAMILAPGKSAVFIDPYSKDDIDNYIVYYKKDYTNNMRQFSCGFTGDEMEKSASSANQGVTFGDCDLRTYRLAIAATGEYTAFHGGTVSAGLSAQVTTVNRVNGIYERDLSVTMTIIANNNLLVYTNATTDPYTNNNGGTMIGQNQTNITSVIGSANYDIGHVVSTGGGGLAGLGVVCVSSQKARGVTGSPSPINDAFDIDFVAHEMGHQFRGNHSFNGSVGSCGGGNRNDPTAYEPGSGSTIMAYAGICGSQNVQANSDALFHGISLQEIGNFITTGSGNTCPVKTPLSNIAPTIVSTNGNVTVPKSTPFALTANATDPDGNTLTYTWEQMNNQVTFPQPPVATSTGGPNFRATLPSTNPTRYFPNLNALKNGGPFTWEVLPSVARTMNFRATVRDNAAGGGCNDTKDVTVTVDANSGPFIVNIPSATGISYPGNSSQTVTWAVAGTNVAPVSCANVNILLSTDGGLTYPTVLATNVSNNGSATVTYPNTATTTARVMVICANGTFFDISNNNFTITAATSDYTLTTTQSTVSVCQPTNAVYNINVGQIGTFSNSVTLSVTGVPAGATATFSTNPVTPVGTSNLTISNTGSAAPGSYNLVLQGNSTSGIKTVNLTLNISAGTPGVVTLVSPTNGATSVSIPTNFTWNAATGTGITYDIDISTSATFTPIVDNATGLSATNYTSSVLSASTQYFWRVRAVSGCGTGAFSSTFSFTSGQVQSCDTINFPPPGTLTVYANAGQFINGWTFQFQDLSKANFYSAASHAGLTNVTGTLIAVRNAKSSASNASISVNVWDNTGAGGAPGNILGSVNIPLSALNTVPNGNENAFFEILFNNSINVGSNPFFLGFTMNGFTANDSLGLFSNTDGDTQPSMVWEQWNDNTWHQYNTAGSWNLDIAMYISPYMTNVPPTALPTANVTQVCAGGMVNFNGTTSTNASGYNWVFQGGTPATSTSATPTVTYATAGTYKAYLLVDGQCQGQALDSLTITVNPLPTVTANASSTSICTGGQVILTGGGATTYTWNNGVTDGVAFTPTATTTYTVTGTDANGCQNTAQVTVTVGSTLTVTANSTATTVCAGTQVTLTGGGATTYTWNNGVTDGVAFTPTATTTYTVTGTAGGCSNTAQITITVNPLPTVTANTTNTSVCAGTQVTLTGGGATTYTWNNGVTNGVAFTPTATTTYTVTGTNANGCQNTAQITIAVNQLPTANVVATPNTNICQNLAVQFDASSSVGANSYNWAFPQGNPSISSSTIVNPVVSFGSAGTHNYALIVSNACGTNTFNGSIVIDVCNGIDDLEEKVFFNSYFDNVNNNLNLSFVNLKQGIYNFNVVNTLGQIIINKQIVITSKEENIIVPFTETSKGIYFINVFNAEANFNNKFLK